MINKATRPAPDEEAPVPAIPRQTQIRKRRGERKMIYKVWVCLEAEYDDIEADSEDEAFMIASEAAMGGGDWSYRIEKQEENEE